MKMNKYTIFTGSSEEDLQKLVSILSKWFGSDNATFSIIKNRHTNGIGYIGYWLVMSHRDMNFWNKARILRDARLLGNGFILALEATSIHEPHYISSDKDYWKVES